MNGFGTNKESSRNPPYLLRRSKRESCLELPDKIEQILYLELTEEQRECYTEVRLSAEGELDKQRRASEAAMRMKILTQLLRLRQPVAIHA